LVSEIDYSCNAAHGFLPLIGRPSFGDRFLFVECLTAGITQWYKVAGADVGHFLPKDKNL
jgi:hypothetical protein